MKRSLIMMFVNCIAFASALVIVSVSIAGPASPDTTNQLCEYTAVDRDGDSSVINTSSGVPLEFLSDTLDVLTFDLRTRQWSRASAAPASAAETTATLGFDPRVIRRKVNGWTSAPEAADFSLPGLVTNTTAYPWSAICWVERFENGLVNGCSGALIDPLHVLCAAHCLTHGDIDSIHVAPGFSGWNAPFGYARVVRFHIWSAWLSNENPGNDMLLMQLDRPIGAGTGWLGYGYSNENSYYTTDTWNMTGYPGDHPDHGHDNLTMYNRTGHYDFVGPSTLMFERDIEHGESGSPCYKNYQVGGIASAMDCDLFGCSSIHTKVDAMKYAQLQTWIAGATPTTPHLATMDIRLAPSPAYPGTILDGIEFLVHNYSSAVSTSRYGSVYLSADRTITRADRYMTTIHDYTSLGPKQSARMSTHGQGIPCDIVTGTTWYVGVIMSDGTVTHPEDVAVLFIPRPPSVQVTVGTNPDGLEYWMSTNTIPRTRFTSRQTLALPPQSWVTLETTPIQSVNQGTQYIFQQWSPDAPGSTRLVFNTGNCGALRVATFETQHLLTTQIEGSGSVSPVGGWFRQGTQIALTARSQSDPFKEWDGFGNGSYTGCLNPSVVVMRGAITQRAVFSTESPSQVMVSFMSCTDDIALTIDGEEYTTPMAFCWPPGSRHTVSAPDGIVIADGVRDIFDGWSIGGARTREITVPTTSPYVIEALYQRQFYYERIVDGSGEVEPPSGWYDSAQSITITASPDCGYSFADWIGTGSGSYTGEDGSRLITLEGPVTQTARFLLDTPLDFSADPDPALATISESGRMEWIDYDADGDPDLAVWDRDIRELELFTNNAGEFSRSLYTNLEGKGGFPAKWIDFDNDGDLDAAIWCQDRHKVKILVNSGGILTVREIPNLNGRGDWSWIDYDTDGDLDLAIWNTGDREIELVRNSNGFMLETTITGIQGTENWEWVDYDNDGDLDLCVRGGGIELIKNSNGAMSEIASAALNYAGSGVWVDYDGDGDLDLWVNGSSTSPIIRNDGSVFTALAMPGLGTIGSYKDYIWFDADLDGDKDLAIWDGASRVALAVNGGGSLGVTEYRVRGDDGWLWVDVDDDGDLDLTVVGDGREGVLFENQGGHLSLMVSDALTHAASGLDWLWIDYDGDGDLDLTTRKSTSVGVARNDAGTFTYISTPIITASSDWSWIDYDADGDLDVYAGERLFRTDDGQFIDVTSPDLESLQSVAPRAWLDIDFDGDLDLTAGPTPAVLRNNGGVLDALQDIDLTALRSMDDWVWLDYDSDSDCDLGVWDADNARINLRRSTPPCQNNWLRLNLSGSVTSGIGSFAAIRIEYDNRAQSTVPGIPYGTSVSMDSSCPECPTFAGVSQTASSTADTRLRFASVLVGIADAAVVDRIDVLWASGRRQTYLNVPANQVFSIVEPPDDQSTTPPAALAVVDGDTISVMAGDSLTLSQGANLTLLAWALTGTSNKVRAVSIQWLFDGAALSDTGMISGANTASLSLANLARECSGMYSYLVADQWGVRESDPVRVSVLAPSCSCDCHGDPICDTVHNIFDVVRTVDVAFRGVAPSVTRECVFQREDFDCDGVVGILDVVTIVGVVFRGGNPGVLLCNPCAQSPSSTLLGDQEKRNEGYQIGVDAAVGTESVKGARGESKRSW